jgi:molybdenum cofactor cytidylyltransferase
MPAAIILAAGQSRRMGTQKLLLPIGEKTMIAHIVDQILAAAVDGSISPVIVVVSEKSPDREAIINSLAGRQIQFVGNPDPESEMLSSIRCGLRALRPDCAAAMIALGDQPSIQVTLVKALLSQFRARGKGIVAPNYSGRRGHPVILSSRYFPEALNQYDDVGLRGLLEAHENDVSEVACNQSGILEDLDSPADYERYQRQQSEAT